MYQTKVEIYSDQNYKQVFIVYNELMQKFVKKFKKYPNSSISIGVHSKKGKVQGYFLSIMKDNENSNEFNWISNQVFA